MSSAISATSNADITTNSCAKQLKSTTAAATVDCHPISAQTAAAIVDCHPMLLERAAAPPTGCNSNRRHQQMLEQQPQVYKYQPPSSTFAISSECHQQVQQKVGTPVHQLHQQQPSFVRSDNRVATPAAPPKPMASTAVAAVAATAPSTAPFCYVASSRPSSSSSSSGNCTASSPLSDASSNSGGSRRSRAAEEFSPGDHFAKQSMRSSRLAGKGNTWLRFRQENQAMNDLMLEDQTGIAFEIIERRCGPPVAETTAHQKPTALHLH